MLGMMTTSCAPATPTTDQEDALLENHVAKVVESGPFARAELLRKLLLYLWENRGRDFNEYSVATEALAAAPTSIPKQTHR